MRVLMIAQSNFDYDARIIRFASALNEKGIIVDAICLGNEVQSRFEVKNDGNIYRVMKNFNQDSILSYIFNSIVFLILSLIKSITISFKSKYDLIHVHNMPDYLVFAALYHKLKGVPVILDIHDLTVELFKEKWAEKKFKQFKFILLFVEKVSCKFANHIITVTNECVRILVNRGIKAEKITLIMNSADENDFTFSPPSLHQANSNKFKILYHGTIAIRFGIHNFIKALPHIIKSVPDIEFHIYGKTDNDYTTELQNLIENLNLTNVVFFKGFIPYYEINGLIKEFDMAAITYEQTEYMNLAMPTKAGEYALTGLPMIISSLSSVKSIFRNESVIYIDPNDPEFISDAVVKLHNDITQRIELSSKAYEDIKNISWNKMKKQYLELVSDLTDK